MKKQSGSPVTVYTMGVAAFFLACFLLLVVFGAQTYRKVVAGQNENHQSRALLSYLSACVRNGDGAGAIEVRGDAADEASRMLVAADGETGYAVRIYLENGSLMEEYGPINEKPALSAAQEIGRTETFRIEELSEGTYTVTTDAGRVLFHVRSREAEEMTDER